MSSVAVCVCERPLCMAAGLQLCVSLHYTGVKLGKPQQHSCNSSQHHPSQEETGQEWKLKNEEGSLRCDIFCGLDSTPPPPKKFSSHSPSLVLLSVLSLFCATLPCKSFVPQQLRGEATLCSRPETLCTVMVPQHSFLCIRLTYTNTVHAHPEIQQYCPLIVGFRARYYEIRRHNYNKVHYYINRCTFNSILWC